MPVRSRTIVTGSFKNSVVGIISEVNEAFGSASSESFFKTRKSLLAKFKKKPRPSVHPFQWSLDVQANLRALRWWFANLRAGNIPTDGIRYKRSGEIGNSFDVDLINEDENTTTLRVKSNAVDRQGRFKYRWVVGTFDVRRGARWQIVGHKRTGWWLLRNQVEDAFDEYENALMKEFDILVKRQNR